MASNQSIAILIDCIFSVAYDTFTLALNTEVEYLEAWDIIVIETDQQHCEHPQLQQRKGINSYDVFTSLGIGDTTALDILRPVERKQPSLTGMILSGQGVFSAIT